jgi:hypothetical protein
VALGLAVRSDWTQTFRTPGWGGGSFGGRWILRVAT